MRQSLQMAMLIVPLGPWPQITELWVWSPPHTRGSTLRGCATLIHMPVSPCPFGKRGWKEGLLSSTTPHTGRVLRTRAERFCVFFGRKRLDF